MGDLNEKSVSKSQHRLMSQAYGVKRWKSTKGKEGLNPKEIGKKYRKTITDIADRMTTKQLKDFAKAKEGKLPDRVNEKRYVPYLDTDADTPISKKYKNLHGFADYRDWIKKSKNKKKN